MTYAPPLAFSLPLSLLSPSHLSVPVESRTSAVAYRTGGARCERRLSLSLSPRSPSLRFVPPLIEPDVTISVIRLSDGFHGRHSQGRAAEVGQEPERPVPRIPPSRGTADTQARP